MQTTTRTGIIFIVGVLTIGTLALKYNVDGDHQIPTHLTRASEEEHLEEFKLSTRMQSAKDEERSELKERWKSLVTGLDNPYALTSEERASVDALSSETVAQLACGENLAKLLAYFKETKDLRPLDGSVHKCVRAVLLSPRAREAREQVLGLSAEDPTIPEGLKNLWACYAAEGCGENEIEEFLGDLSASEPSQVTSQAIRQDALLSFCSANAGDSPLSMMSLAVDQLALGITSSRGKLISQSLVDHLPDNVSFEDMALLIVGKSPSTDVGRKNISSVETEFFERWAENAPADAANFVMAESTSLSPNLIRGISSTVTNTNAATGAEWAESFPQGEYRDVALAGAIDALGPNLSEAKRLAMQIDDAELRSNALSRISSYQASLDAIKNRGK